MARKVFAFIVVFLLLASIIGSAVVIIVEK